MKDNSYEEYKKEFSRTQRKRDKFFEGKVCLAVGVFLLLLSLYFLPFRAYNAGELRGDELKTGKVYYIENLQILHAKIEEDSICCMAKFQDKDQKEWLISFTPDGDEQLVNRIQTVKKVEQLFKPGDYHELDMETSGYFYVEDVPSEASSYYAVYSGNYTETGDVTKLKLNADYLCRWDGNYTLEVLSRPGYILCGFVFGIIGIIWGGFLILKNRTGKKTEGEEQ